MFSLKRFSPKVQIYVNESSFFIGYVAITEGIKKKLKIDFPLIKIHKTVIIRILYSDIFKRLFLNVFLPEYN